MHMRPLGQGLQVSAIGYGSPLGLSEGCLPTREAGIALIRAAVDRASPSSAPLRCTARSPTRRPLVRHSRRYATSSSSPRSSTSLDDDGRQTGLSSRPAHVTTAVNGPQKIVKETEGQDA